MTTFVRHGLASVHVAGEHRSRLLLSRKCVVDPSSVDGLFAYVPSFLLPSGQYATCHRILPFLPPALGHYAVQTAHAHNKQQATGVRWLWWTGKAGLLSHSRLILFTLPETPTYLVQIVVLSARSYQRYGHKLTSQF